METKTNNKEIGIEINQAKRHKRHIWTWTVFCIIHAVVVMNIVPTMKITMQTKVYEPSSLMVFWNAAIFIIFVVQIGYHWMRYNSYMSLIKTHA